MPRNRHTVEQIITKLREAEVALSKGQPVAQACRNLGITAQATRGTVESGTVCDSVGGASARETLATTRQPDSSPSGPGVAATRS
jgi:hypothetical protein